MFYDIYKNNRLVAEEVLPESVLEIYLNYAPKNLLWKFTRGGSESWCSRYKGVSLLGDLNTALQKIARNLKTDTSHAMDALVEDLVDNLGSFKNRIETEYWETLTFKKNGEW